MLIQRAWIEDIVVAWCEAVYVCRKEFLCSLIITMFERNYDGESYYLYVLSNS